MKDLLKKIIEMDERARKAEEQAKSEKLKSEAEIEELRDKIYNDYIERAKDRVEKNIAVDKANAEKKIAEYSASAEKAKHDMSAIYYAYGNKWVDEIVGRVLS